MIKYDDDDDDAGDGDDDADDDDGGDDDDDDDDDDDVDDDDEDENDDDDEDENDDDDEFNLSGWSFVRWMVGDDSLDISLTLFNTLWTQMVKIRLIEFGGWAVAKTFTSLDHWTQHIASWRSAAHRKTLHLPEVWSTSKPLLDLMGAR